MKTIMVRVNKKNVTSIAKKLRLTVNDEEIEGILRDYKKAVKRYPEETWDYIIKILLYEVTESQDNINCK